MAFTWQTEGNADVEPQHFLGTKSGETQPLTISTDQEPRMVFASDGNISIKPTGDGAVDRMRIAVDGNVGIGTGMEGPAAKLDVAGTVKANKLEVTETVKAQTVDADEYKGLPQTTSQWTSGTSGVISYSGGNVGIGTNTPVTRLDVAGTVKAGTVDAGDYRKNGSPLVTSQWISGASGIISYSGGNVGIGKSIPAAKLDVAGTVNATDYQKNGSPLATSQWTSGAGGIISYSGGNVGIGKSTPATRLDVAGTVNATEYQKNGSPLATSQWISGAGGIISYSGGKVGIGTGAPVRNLHVQGSEIHSGGGGAGYSFGDRNTTAFVQVPERGERWQLYSVDGKARLSSGGDKLTVTTAGDVTITGTLTQGSDARMKANIAKLTDVLGKLEAINGVSFERIGTRASATSPARRNFGVIAQEVEEVFPELVSEHGGEELKTVDYSGLAGILVEAAKELKAHNDELRSRIEALERD